MSDLSPCLRRGPKSKLTDQQVREIRILLLNPQVIVAQVARQYGVSRQTLYTRFDIANTRNDSFIKHVTIQLNGYDGGKTHRTENNT